MFQASIDSFGVPGNLWVMTGGKINFPLEDEKENTSNL